MKRKADHPIQDIILNRWSPRAMTGEPISDDVLMSLFEAARWAPSSYNAQPWRFIYAKQKTPAFEKMMSVMTDFNKTWTNKAAVLGLIISRKFFESNGKPAHTHAFDTGAAWENLALEGTSRGLVIHGMEGFDYAKARQTFQVPEEYEVLAMFAVGVHAPASTLSPELQKRESPSDRKKIEEFIMKDHFR